MKDNCHFTLTITQICLDLLEADVTKVGVRDVSDKDPLDLEDPLPFVGRPHGTASRVVNLKGGNHHEDIMGLGCMVLTGVNISAIPQKCPLLGLFSLVKKGMHVTLGTDLALTLKKR